MKNTIASRRFILVMLYVLSIAMFGLAIEYTRIEFGVTTNVEAAATPGGSDGQVQFNDAGSFGGDSGFTFNKTTNAATLGSTLTLGNNQIVLGQNGMDSSVSLTVSNTISATSLISTTGNIEAGIDLAAAGDLRTSSGILFTDAAGTVAYIDIEDLRGASDNDVLTFDSATSKIELTANVSGSELNITLHPKAAYVGNDLTTPALIGNTRIPSVRFGDSADPDEEYASWSRYIDDDFSTTSIYADVFYSVEDTSGTVSCTVYVDAATPGDGVDIDTINNSAANTNTGSPNSTSDGLSKITVTLTSTDALAAGDLAVFTLTASFTGSEAVKVRHIVIRE